MLQGGQGLFYMLATGLIAVVLATLRQLPPSFTVHFIRPAMGGGLQATGCLVHGGSQMLVAESQVFDESGKLLGQGSGTFIRSRIPLDANIGYA